MVNVWRQARAIALLPGTAAVLVPIAVLIGSGSDLGWGPGGVPGAAPALLGLVLIAAGFVLWLWTVRLFARVGKGTLAPWDPTRHLVVEGPYRHVRNPMITAVLAVLAGEAVLFGSLPLLIWFATFFTVNCVFIWLHEEPRLQRRFGEDYLAYAQNVPRWLPRRTPWSTQRRD